MCSVHHRHIIVHREYHHDHQQGLVSVRIEQVLQLVHALDMLAHLEPGILVRLVLARVSRIDAVRSNLAAFFGNELFSVIHNSQFLAGSFARSDMDVRMGFFQPRVVTIR